MTPVLQPLLKRLEATTLIETKRSKQAQKTGAQQEEAPEEHTEVLREDDSAPVGETIENESDKCRDVIALQTTRETSEGECPTEETVDERKDGSSVRREDSKQEAKVPVVSESKKDEKSSEKVSVKKHEAAETIKPGEITETEKPKPEVEVKQKESVTDVELKKPKVIRSVADTPEAKRKEESKADQKRDGKTPIASKPEEKRVSPQTAARGGVTALLSNEERAGAPKIAKHFTSEFESSAEVVEREEEAQMLHNDRQELVGEGLKEEVLNLKREADEAFDESVAEGSETRGSRLVSKPKGNIVVTGSESKNQKVESTSDFLPESTLSKVIRLRHELVKVSPKEETTEMKPREKVSPESLSEDEAGTEPELPSQIRMRQEPAEDKQNLQSENLQSENLQSQNLQSQNLQSQNLQSQNLQSENLQSQNLQSQKLQSENLQSENLQSENLQEPSVTEPSVREPSVKDRTKLQQNKKSQHQTGREDGSTRTRELEVDAPLCRHTTPPTVENLVETRVVFAEPEKKEKDSSGDEHESHVSVETPPFSLSVSTLLSLLSYHFIKSSREDDDAAATSQRTAESKQLPAVKQPEVAEKKKLEKRISPQEETKAAIKPQAVVKTEEPAKSEKPSVVEKKSPPTDETKGPVQAPGGVKKETVLLKKGKIQLEEETKFEIPTLKKSTRVVKAVEEEQEVIKLKKVPSAPPKEAEVEEKPQKVTRTTVFEVEEMVHEEETVEMSVSTRRRAEERTPRDKADVVKKPEVIKPKEEQTEAPKDAWSRQRPVTKDQKPEDTISLKKTPKTPKEEESTPPTAVLKKAKKLPSDEVEPEIIKLKPFEKPVKAADEPEKDKKERPTRDTEPFQKGERISREVEPKELPRKPVKTPPEVKEPPAKVLTPLDKKKSPEKEPEEVKALTKVKKIPTQEQEIESVKLKPFSRPSKEEAVPEKKPAEEKEKKSLDDLQPRRKTPDEKLKEREPVGRAKKPEIPETPEKKLEKTKELDSVTAEKTASPVPTSVKKPEKVSEEPKPLQLKKGVTPKAKEEKEEVALKPLEQLKKVGLKKTPSPQVEKLKEAAPVERKTSIDRLKKVPKTVSPVESIEAVTLKKVLKKPSPEEEKSAEPARPDKGKFPLVKEVSPGAVQMKKVATQPEEEVFEEEYEAEEETEQEEEEEVWGWELVPRDSGGSEDWEGDTQEGALEVPGMTRREGQPAEEAGRGRGRGLKPKQTPSPGEGRGRGLKPGGKGPSPPEDPFGGFKLKAVPLKFIKKLKDIVLQEAESIGSAAVFECEVSPSTAITSWMKDGSNLRESPKHKFTSDGKDRKLNIIDVQLSDTGEYSCVAKNAGKEITCTAKLIVEELPVKWIKELEEETSALKGQPIYMTCELNKERDVVWKKNNEVLKKKANKIQINIIGMQHAVTIQNSSEQDTGSYSCEVSGQEEVKTTSNVKVIEIIKDWIVKPLRDQHVKPKTAATFKCELYKDTPNWKWLKGEIEISPSDKLEVKQDGKELTLTIKNCQPEDVAEYALEVEGRVYTAKLTLGEREAEILKPLASVEVTEKGDAVFETEISEDDVPGEWKLKGEVLTRSPTYDIFMEGRVRRLTLKSCQLDQAGEVSYQALNAMTSAMLNVKEIEMDFVVPLKDVSVPEKKQAKFECSITKDVSKVMWYRGGDIITPDQKYDIIDDGKKHMLIINCCEFDDEDEYTIEVLSKKSTARLAVEGIRLKLISPIKDQTVKEGKTARFELELSHENIPVTWFKNDVKIHPSRTVVAHVDGKKHVLEIRDVTLDDTCQIKAEAKGVPSMANLTVIEGDAYFTVKLQDYTAMEKDEVVLDCELSKDVNVVWYHDGAEVKASKMVAIKAEDKRRTLVIKRVGDKDKGQYLCDCGTDKTTATLHIEARSIKVVRPMYGVEVFDGETARFEVELSEDDVHGQWKLNGDVLSPSADVEIVEDGAKHTLVLYNCKVPLTGELSFTAANARCSANLKVKEPPVSFLTPLADLHVYEKDEAKFELEISREPKSFRWLKGSQELSNDDKFELVLEGKRHALIVKSAKYEDEGKYMFEAEDKRTSGKLFIKGIRLEFIKPIKDVTVKERETAEFRVELSHEKIPVVWYKNDVRLHPSKVVHMSEDGKGHRLSFKEVTVDDTSMVKVEAMGKTSEAMLTVLEGDLYFTAKLQNYTAVEKDEVVLTCELSKAGGEVRWFKDGTEICPSKNVLLQSDGKRCIIVLKRALKSNMGTYTCDCGTDKTTADLNIEERDIKVVRPLYSVEVTETETAKFETEISEEDLHATWKLKEETLHPSADVEIKEEGTRHILILFNCRKDMAGSLDFSAANAKSSAQLRVKAGRMLMSRPPQCQVAGRCDQLSRAGPVAGLQLAHHED
ncbi:unnamed protein product [Pleuronectes platessa]|uniref:non-specific serine/threonine protein kinase n=1 Tax=Pleuronectes platessa TaxID=8262 RepID=A0A9N7TLV9_PLEPL|nr:unnamed protein product [Pleuronectes platessa]